MKKKNIIVGIVLGIIVLLIIFCYINVERKPLTQSTSTSNKCNEDDGYCVYKYDGKEYFVFNKDYKNEYDVENYSSTGANDFKKIKEFSYLTYEEYSDFCEKYGITKKYNKEDSNYIVYFYSTKDAGSVDAKLVDVKYENDKAILYVWHKVNSVGSVDCGDCIASVNRAYFIIIPTNNRVSDYEVKPVIHRIEYNKIAKLYPLDGYNYSTEDNIKLALQDHINSNNSKLNEIINKCLDELGKKHTIKVDTYLDDIHLISYMDLVNSVFKIQGGTKALSYVGYADDMILYYSSYNNDDYYEYSYAYVDRSDMLYDVFSEFGNDFLENIDRYEISLNEDNDDYIIESRVTSYRNRNTKYYINKKTYLIDKVITDYGKTNSFSYINDNILIPDDVSANARVAALNKY